MKKFLSILLVFSIMCYSGITAFATENISQIQRKNNEILANEQYQALLDNLLTKNNYQKSIHASKNYYGGAYINNNGNLVVCITEDNRVNIDEVKKFTSNNDILIKKVKYTFEELVEEQERISKLYEELYASNMSVSSELTDILNSFCGTYIDEEKNILFVEIENLTEEKIEIFKKCFSCKDFVDFTQGNLSIMLSSVNPGTGIATTSGRTLSAGYPVYFTNSEGQRVKGFITAGHSYEVGDHVLNSSRYQIGICVASVLSNKTDAALVQITNPNYTVSNVTQYGGVTLSETTYVQPAQGSLMYKEGKSSYQTSGTVVSTSVTRPCGGVTLYDIIKSTVSVIPGDSGGVVYMPDGKIVGSISSADYSGEASLETFHYSYICKVANVHSALNCRIWG